VTRIFSTPRLAEVTGIYISYIGDYAYLALGIQHPEEDTGVKVGSSRARDGTCAAANNTL
jgi:secreted PhoX family phosphatase